MYSYSDTVVTGRKIDPDLLAVPDIQMQKWSRRKVQKINELFLTFLIKVNNYTVNVPSNINKIKRRPLLAMAVQYIHSIFENIKMIQLLKKGKYFIEIKFELSKPDRMNGGEEGAGCEDFVRNIELSWTA